uniref:Uncharacterized protein n=1 Tax=Anguilla anguilla TaxID=7936 RepID=A0A0E9RKT9_ANGAN
MVLNLTHLVLKQIHSLFLYLKHNIKDIFYYPFQRTQLISSKSKYRCGYCF